MSQDWPNFGDDRPEGSQESDSDFQNSIIWEDSEDVYKPIPKNIQNFQLERGIETATFESVYIKADALEKLKTHLGYNLQIEQGGILFGNAYIDPQQDKIYVEVTVAAPAPATIGTGAHLEFTPESWSRIMDSAKHEHPQENIVGWYHSHPNLGVFMSGTDMRTQQAFFYHPWCLSIVCDPATGDIGYFLGPNAIPLRPVTFTSKKEEYSPEFGGETEQTATDPSEINNPPIIPTGDRNTITKTPARSRLVLAGSFVGLLFAIIVLVIPFFTNDLSYNYFSPQPSPFEAHIITMYARDFKEVRNSNLLPVRDTGDKIGNGNEVAFLVIRRSDQIGNNGGEFQLRLYSIPIKSKNNITGNSNDKIFKNMMGQTGNELLHKSNKFREKTITLGFGQSNIIWIPIFSSHATNDNGSRTVRDIIHIPQEITYKDADDKEHQIQIGRIVKYD